MDHKAITIYHNGYEPYSYNHLTIMAMDHELFKKLWTVDCRLWTNTIPQIKYNLQP